MFYLCHKKFVFELFNQSWFWPVLTPSVFTVFGRVPINSNFCSSKSDEMTMMPNCISAAGLFPLFSRFPEKLLRLGHGATPQFATNSARVTADIYLRAYICTQSKICKYIITNTQIHKYKYTNSTMWYWTYICVLILHCTARRVIYSTNIGEIAANTQIPTRPRHFLVGHWYDSARKIPTPSKKGFPKLQENVQINIVWNGHWIYMQIYAGICELKS